MANMPNESLSLICQKLLEASILSDQDHTVVIYDLAYLNKNVQQLKTSFNDDTLHAIAVKANPFMKILSLLSKMGCGAEVASFGELSMALKAGINPEHIVFDSPIKTEEELSFALQKGVRLNCDNMEELKRVEQWYQHNKPKQSIGLRINPQCEAGSISSTSVGETYSKFGIPIEECRDDIKQAYKTCSWLNGIHVHVGSQGCLPEGIIKGIKKVYDLAQEINEEMVQEGNANRITVFDLGGGLPVQYSQQDISITMSDYVNLLKDACPDLFSGHYKLITEFGRYIHANSAFAISKVEYVKESGGIKTAMIHVGADMFIRPCYNPDDWAHELFVMDSEGKVKEGNSETYHVAGPLCFAGDILARDCRLPVIEPGDYLGIKDVGAYTLSMWSRYNSRLMPKVMGYDSNEDEFIVIKEKETVDQLVAFWT